MWPFLGTPRSVLHQQLDGQSCQTTQGRRLSRTLSVWTGGAAKSSQKKKKKQTKHKQKEMRTEQKWCMSVKNVFFKSHLEKWMNKCFMSDSFTVHNLLSLRSHSCTFLAVKSNVNKALPNYHLLLVLQFYDNQRSVLLVWQSMFSLNFLSVEFWSLPFVSAYFDLWPQGYLYLTKSICSTL